MDNELKKLYALTEQRIRRNCNQIGCADCQFENTKNCASEIQVRIIDLEYQEK
jgi:hypothetical protein